MEQLNAAEVSSLYGVKMGEYGDAGVSSVMALMAAAQEAPGDGGGLNKRVPLQSSFSSFHGQAECLVSAMFQPHHMKLQTVREQLVMPAEPVSSMPMVKSKEGCCNLSNQFEFQTERAGNCSAESASLQLVSTAVTSLAEHYREAQLIMSPDALSSHFNVNSRRMNPSATDEEKVDIMKAKILGHPQYPCLLEAYIDCQKVGAPPEEVARLDAVRKEYKNLLNPTTISVGMDPELDRFMETYCQMLIKYQEELTKPFDEAMAFFRQIGTRLNSLSKETMIITPSVENDEKTERGGSSDEEDCSTGEMEYQEMDQYFEDRELKDRLLSKYSGYLSSLKKKFMKTKKKGKLPKDARQKLLDWWNVHYQWPYPSENEKVALAESTGLDQKQVNNWFINQRKRHWKPPENVQFVVMDGDNPHSGALYMDKHFMNGGSAFHLDC